MLAFCRVSAQSRGEMKSKEVRAREDEREDDWTTPDEPALIRASKSTAV